MDNAPQPEKRTLPLVVLVAIVALGIPLVLSIVLSVIAIAGGVVAYLLAEQSVEERQAPVLAEPVLDEWEPPEPPLEIPEPPEPPGEPEPPVVDVDEPALGSVETAVIKSVMTKNASGFKHCYEKALAQDPTLEGKVTLTFTIDESGKVSEAGVGTSTLGDAEVETCMVNRLKKMRFPEPWAGSLKVSYPIVFSPSG